MKYSIQPYSNELKQIINKLKNKIMGVTLYDKIGCENYSNIISNIDNLDSLLDEFNIKPNSSTNEFEIRHSIYIETIGNNSMDLRYSTWCEFLENYVWSFFDSQEISFEEFNSDDVGTINSNNMKLLIKHLNSIDVDGKRNKEIKEFLLKHKKGITYS